MEPLEVNRHHLRKLVLSVLECLRESRQDLNHCFDRLVFIRNAGAPAQAEEECKQLDREIIALSEQMLNVTKTAIDLADKIKQALVQPDHYAPPLMGDFNDKYRDLTPLQRSLVREGKIELPTRSKIPTHYWENIGTPRPPAKILSKPIYKPRSKKKIPRGDMPL